MGEFAIPFVAKKVYYASYNDDDNLVEADESTKRTKKYADGWFLNEMSLRTGVKIDPSVSRDLYVGDCTGKPQLMQRCWAESDDKNGARITQSMWGSLETHEFSFGGELSTGEGGNAKEFEYEPDDRILIVRFRIRCKNATNAQINMIHKDTVGGDLSMFATLTWTGPRYTSDLIGKVIKEEQAVSPDVISGGGARKVVLHMDYVRIG